LISIVVYSRNDNHGEDLFKRMYLSLYTNITLLEEAQIYSEIIIVDYNTPKNSKKLYEILDFKSNKYVKIRYIIIEEEFHLQFKDSDKLPMNNMLARNIGIRRSNEEYILSTGIDVIFSKELILKFKNLISGNLYRVDRYDVNKLILQINTLNTDKILGLCEKNIIDVHFNTNKGKFLDTNFPSLHTNNCGDFQLTHRDVWFDLKGYPEIDLMGTHCDTLFEYMAILYGVKERVFEEKLYHIDHSSRWLKPIYTHILRNWRMLYLKFGYDVMKYKKEYYSLAKDVSNDIKETTYLEQIGVNILSEEQYKNYILKMIKNQKPIIFNDDNWGAKNYSFEEIEV